MEKHLKTITINNATFTLDMQYPLVRDLVPPTFENPARILEHFFGSKGEKTTKKLIAAMLEDGCDNDIAMAYLLTMTLQNYGEFKKAEKIIIKLLKNHPDNLLVRCAYANNLVFNNQVDDIPAVFNNTFDLDKVTPERDLPLITFVQFMSIVGTYYNYKGDLPNCKKHLSYLMEVAPDHDDTQRLFVWCAMLTMEQEFFEAAEDHETNCTF